MKIVNRIIFGLVAALGLMLIISITDEYYRSRAVIEIVTEKLENKAYVDLISAAYYDKTPVFEGTITDEDKEFLILIYQAAHVTKSTTGLIVLDGFQLLIIQKSGTLLPEYFDVIVDAKSEIKHTYTGFNMYNLGLYSIFNPETQGSLLLRNDFEKEDIFQDISKISFVKKEETILEFNVNLTKDLFTITEPLETYISLNSEAPKENITGVDYNNPIVINVRDKSIRNSVIYLVAIVGVYYLVFVRQRKTLGRVKASQGLKKDIDRINKTDNPDFK